MGTIPWASWLVWVVALRLERCARVMGSGHADPAFYMHLATHLARGDGATIDFIWHYGVPVSSVHHYGPDYWLPLPSLWMAAAMAVAGTTPRVAVTVGVLMGVVFAGAVGWLAWNVTRSRIAAAASLSCALFLPGIERFSTSPESVVYFAAFGALALALSAVRRPSTRTRMGLGMCIGAAMLCRNDGLLLLTAALTVSCIAHGVRRSAVILSGCLLVYAPYALQLYASTGHVMPATTALPFLTGYEDLYRVGPGQGLDALVQKGMSWNVDVRLDAIHHRKDELVAELGPAFLAMTGATVGALVSTRLYRRLRQGAAIRPTTLARRVQSPLATALGFVILESVFHTIVTPVVSSAGAFVRSLPLVASVLVVTTMAAILYLAGQRSSRSSSVGLAGVVARLGLLGVVGWAWWAWREPGRVGAEQLVREGTEIQQAVRAIASRVESDRGCALVSPVIMTRNPWELTQETGIPAVQIPQADLPTILGIARKYGVTHLIPDGRRVALRDHAALTSSSGPFVVLAAGRTPIWRLREQSALHCSSPSKGQ